MRDSEELRIFLDDLHASEPQSVGTLYRETLRGAPKYAFEFDRRWLSSRAGVLLSADLANFPGRQFLGAGRELFGCFEDALPDRWGRLLLKRREELEAEREGRMPRALTAFDMLCGIDDAVRVGAFRFKRGTDEGFLRATDPMSVPPVARLRELTEAAARIEESEVRGTLPEEKWLLQLLAPGTSLGGARPKATVRDEAGNLWVAKFPSRNDLYDVGAWEHFAHRLAARAGIDTVETRILRVGEGGHVFLMRRFDRSEGRRIHFASAMTMTGLTDGAGAATGNGYPDIAEAILACAEDTDGQLKELFRRVAFSIAIGNADDHIRNHGFLLGKAGWRLSPVYDINPTVRRRQSLLITPETDVSDLTVLRDGASSYFLSAYEADRILKEVREAVRDWETVAADLPLAERERRIFGERFRAVI